MPSPQPGLAGAAGERGCFQQHESPRQAGLWGGTEEPPPHQCLTQLLPIPTAQAKEIISREHLGAFVVKALRGFGIPSGTAAAFTQQGEGIVDGVECFRGQSVWGGRPPKAWEEKTCCGHGSALLPFLLPRY